MSDGTHSQSVAGEPARAPLLRITGLSKSFPGLKALDTVSLTVRAGEIVSVVGQNGSGKSTLVKLLAGIYPPDAGAVVEHQELRFVHQDLGLVSSLSTVENLEIGEALGRRGLKPLRGRRERTAAYAAIRRFGGDFDVTVSVNQLSAAERAVVAITRAMSGWEAANGVLILDEPTAALAGDEAGRLFDAVRRVAAEGAGVVFISHRLDEVLGLSDRVVALRDGRVVADVAATDIDHDWLVSTIAGRALADIGLQRHHATSEVVLEADNIVTTALNSVSMTVRAGEILGVTGLLGSGREDLAAAIFGMSSRDSGTVSVAGRLVAPNNPAESIRRGLSYVPADRLRRGAVMTLSVQENLTLPLMRSLRRAFGRLDRRAERREAFDWVTRVELSPPKPDWPLRQFSGGNQQKLVLAKWLRTTPKVMLLDEPTQGVDVGAKAAIYALIDQAAADRAAILVCSSDLNELVALCDRVLVLRRGTVVAELARQDLSEARLVRESLDLDRNPSPRLVRAR